MKFSASPEVDKLWHTHVLCSQNYLQFMAVVKKICPKIDFIHHSLALVLGTEDQKQRRREATRRVYRELFHRECHWVVTGRFFEHSCKYRKKNRGHQYLQSTDDFHLEAFPLSTHPCHQGINVQEKQTRDIGTESWTSFVETVLRCMQIFCETCQIQPCKLCTESHHKISETSTHQVESAENEGVSINKRGFTDEEG